MSTLQPLQVWGYCIHTNASYSAAVILSPQCSSRTSRL